MSDEVYFSTGQAARRLKVTQAKLRALCESGAIESILTPGGQHRISRDEIGRIIREGLPEVPRPLPEAERPHTESRARSHRGETTLFAPPSQALISTADAVAQLEQEVRLVELTNQKEHGLDSLRERDEREAERQAEREEAERRRQMKEQAEIQRLEWQAKWTEYALNAVPYHAPKAYHLEVHRAVEEVLERLKPSQPDSTTRALIHSAIERALTPWHEQKRIAEAIAGACNSHNVPVQMRLDAAWKAKVQTAASDAIARLRAGASAAEMQSAAQNAVAPLIREFESLRIRSEMIESVWTQIPSDREFWEQGKDAVREALSRLPIGTSQRELERARDAALQPIRAKIAAGEEKRLRASLAQPDLRFYLWPEKLRQKASAATSEALNRLPAGSSPGELERAKDDVVARFQRRHERQERKSYLINSGLRQIRPYLDRLISQDWEFDADVQTVARDLEEPIREILAEELLGDETDDQVAALVRDAVREELDS